MGLRKRSIRIFDKSCFRNGIRFACNRSSEGLEFPLKAAATCDAKLIHEAAAIAQEDQILPAFRKIADHRPLCDRQFRTASCMQCRS